MAKKTKWMKQKEAEKQDAKQYATNTRKILDRVPGTSHLKPEALGQLTEAINGIVMNYDQLAAAGDMGAAGQEWGKIEHIIKQMTKLENAFEFNAEGLINENQSKGGDSVAANAIFSEKGQYGFNIDENANISYVAPTKVEGIPSSYTIDQITEGIIPRVDLLEEFDSAMQNQLITKGKLKNYDFDDGYWNKWIGKKLNNTKGLVSIFNDDALGLTDKDGNPTTILEMWQNDPEAGGKIDAKTGLTRSTDFADYSKRNNPAVTTAENPGEEVKYWSGGFNENAMRNYATKVIKQHAKDEWEDNKSSMYPEQKTNKKSYFLGKQNVPALAVDGDVKILNEDPPNITTRTAWNKVKFRKVNGQYQQVNNGKWTNVTKAQLAGALSFDDKVGYTTNDDENEDLNNAINKNVEYNLFSPSTWFK